MPVPDDDGALRSVFRRLADVPDEEWRHFRAGVHERRFAPREHLLLEGAPAPTLHFIAEGLVRMYHNRDGRELVRGFDCEGRFVGSYESVLTGEPARFSAQAIEPTRTLAFTGDLLRRLYDRHPCWDRVGRRILEEQWIRQSDKEWRFRVFTAEEHYRLLLERQWPLFDRVPLNQLASFLGVTPETLSRIRARVRESGTARAGRIEGAGHAGS